MLETVIDSVLTGKLDCALLCKWLMDESVEGIPEDCVLYCCNRNEFVLYFISYLRSQADGILKTNANALPILQPNTPDKILSSSRKHRRSCSDPTNNNDDSLSTKSLRSHESPSTDRKKTGRRVKTKLFPDDKSRESISSDESRLSIGIDRIVISSTPLKNGPKLIDSPSSPLTPVSKSERCDTPRLYRHRSQDKSISLGDYLINAQQKSSKKKRSKNTSDDAERNELDISNCDVFPEIGARKSSSLRLETRRIKPTNIDKTSSRSISLNSFSSECFQQPSPLALEDNNMFKYQKIQPKESANNFEAERSILKQERHKLMEKFNILNTTTSPKTVSPQIRLSNDSTEKTRSFIHADVNKVVFKENLDILVDIYDILMKNGLVLSVNTEMYFLISILLSKQYEQEYVNVEMKLKDNNMKYLLKSIHNCTYFVVKSLWNQKGILDVILDKHSLKILGENKKVRSFFPDLAKFLLNSYGLKSEIEKERKPEKCQQPSKSNGIICFNLETDNSENFPSILSFQNFKKQRDMFYEIFRWYQDLTAGRSKTTFRARVKTLVTAGGWATNHAHLAALYTAHMLVHCLPSDSQESKLSKLQKRLTCPAGQQSYRLPQFYDNEIFYKEFIMYAENESFRVHLRDAIASEIIALDSTPLTNEDRGNPNNDVSKEYLDISRKLCLLSKFLGYLAALPYTQLSVDMTLKTNINNIKEQNYDAPKQRILENNIALRSYCQPCIDIYTITKQSNENNRLCLTIPWVVHFVSMLDYSSLRTNYYKKLLKLLFQIYYNITRNTNLKKNTSILLKSILSWLFDLPHFPQELYCERIDYVPISNDFNIDCCDLIDESILFRLCPFLKEVNVLLLTCKFSHEKESSFRHITPVSLSLNPEDRMKNKEKELQSRLEEELLKSQSSSTRRVLELVMERVTSGCVRELASLVLVDAREHARECARRHVRSRTTDDLVLLQDSLHSLYVELLDKLRCDALETGSSYIRKRVRNALTALLPSHTTPTGPLQALAVSGCVRRLNKWIKDNWSSTAVLCKNIEEEMATLLAIGDAISSSHKTNVDLDAILVSDTDFEAVNVSPAVTIIQLKEQICLILEYESPLELSESLSKCLLCCSKSNIFCRPPTQRAILQMTVDLALVCASRRPSEINDTFLNKLHSIWNTCCPDRKRNIPADTPIPEHRQISPDYRNFNEERSKTPVSDDDTADTKKPIIIINADMNKTNSTVNKSDLTVNKINSTVNKSDLTVNRTNSTVNKGELTVNKGDSVLNRSDLSVNRSVVNDESEMLEFFDRVLCSRNIMLLSDSKCRSCDIWEALAKILVFLMKNNYMSEDSLTEQCLAVYRQDWPQNTLENLSNCMKSVSSRWSRSSTSKFTLFLDFLAEYCGDVDYEPLD